MYRDKLNMAITLGSILQMTLKMQNLGKPLFNVWQYEVTEMSLSPTAADFAAAWWNTVKGTYRAMVGSAITGAFISVLCEEISDPTGGYGTHGIPALEQSGTRDMASLTQMMPTFNAISVTLQVGTRVTKPGGKRFGFLYEADSADNTLQGAIVALVNTHMELMDSELNLLSPALLSALRPVIVRKDATGLPTAHQPVTGFTIKPTTSSQVSRKV